MRSGAARCSSWVRFCWRWRLAADRTAQSAAVVDASGVAHAFAAVFGRAPRVYRAPGRVNLIGEHTDYNDGFVMPMAFDRAVWIALRPRADRQVLVHSLDLGDS